MIINLHAGHNPDGKVACGAVGLIKESTEARILVKKLIELLRQQHHTIYDCTVNDGVNQGDVLKKIVQACNTHKVNLDISIHFNAGVRDGAGDGKTTGTEVFVYDDGSPAYPYAERVCNEISKLGYKNRGVKVRKNLYFLKHTIAPAMLIECCFVDDKDDTSLYNADGMAAAIATAICGFAETLDAGDMLDKLMLRSEIKTPEYWHNALGTMPYFDGFVRALYNKYEGR